MPASRNATNEPEAPAEAPLTRADVRQIVEEALGAQRSTPEAPEPSRGPRRPTDAEYDAMSDRQREGTVRQMVEDAIADIRLHDEVADQRDELERIKADKAPEPEKTPSPFQRFQKFFWGTEPDKP